MFSGTLDAWEEQDALDEMMEQREAMGRIDTPKSDRLQICMTASLLYVCCDDDHRLKATLDMHYNEMYQRMTMINRMEMGLSAI